MNILIVEDDAHKADQIAAFVLTKFPGATCDIRGSFNSGLKRIRESHPDLLLLDMTLPTYDRAPGIREGRLRPLGGYELMRKLRLSKIVVPTVVVTQLETFGTEDEATSLSEISERCAREFSEFYRGAVRFQSSTNSWQSEVTDIITMELKR